MEMRFRALLLVILLGYACTSPSKMSCFENSYIKERKAFKTLPLLTLTNPVIVKEKCGKEWATFGTCCQPYDLLPHLQADERDILTAATSTVNNLAYFHNLANDLLKTLKELALASESPSQPSWTPNIQFAKKFLEDPQNLYHLEAFSNIGSPEMINKFKAKSDNCWKKMIEKRYNSMCSACSGRSKVFFNSTRGLLSGQQCTEALNHCLPYLKEWIRFVQMLSWLMEISPQLEKHYVYVKVHDRVEKAVMDKYLQEIVMNDLASKVSHEGEHAAHSADVEVQICDKFFNLADRPFIEDFSRTLHFEHSTETKKIELWWEASEPVKRSSATISQKMPELEKKLGKLLADWKTKNPNRARSLKLKESKGDNFKLHSDVQFLFSFSDQSIVNNEQSRPMNLTHAFP